MFKINYPILALIVANIIWGGTSPIIKYALGNIPPFSLAFLRFLIASSILFFFIHKKINYSDLKNRWLWIYALSGITLNISFFFLALQRTTAIEATIIASFAPVLTLVGASFYLKEKLTRNAIIGVLVALAGIMIIIFKPAISEGLSGGVLGNLLMLLATVFAVIATIAGRKFLTPANAAGSTFWVFLIGTISFLPFMTAEFCQNPFWFEELNVRGYLGIIYGGLFSSLTAYFAYNWALSKLPAYKTSVFVYIDPIAAALIAIPLLGEVITLPFIIGSTLVFAGILIAEKRLPYHPLHKLRESARI